MEEAARAAEGEMTQALPVTPETLDTLSRRERRRLERLANPPESWTEEEELIATGQMPAMTGDLLAEQDQLARERADAAAAAAQAYKTTAAEPEVAEAPAAVAEPAAEVQSEVAEAPAAVAEPVAEVQPEFAETPDAVAEPAAEVQPEPKWVAEPEQVVDADSGDEVPADLRQLFPQGSLQARAIAAQAAAEPVAPEPADTTAVDEIRRLTHEAMAGINRVAAASATEPQEEPDAHAAPETDVPNSEPLDDMPLNAVPLNPMPLNPMPVDSGEGEPAAANVPALPDGVDVEALWNAPTLSEQDRSPKLTPAFNDVDPEPVELAAAPFVNDVPVPRQPTGTEAPGTEPVWSALVPARPGAHPDSAFGDVDQMREAAPQPTVWDTHPLTNPGATPVRELPSEPVVRELPKPDLSVLLTAQAAPSVGQTPYVSTEPLTTTGAMPQRLAEPQSGGGARHFRWAHLAVIGAIAFVLGVVAWNIARSGS